MNFIENTLFYDIKVGKFLHCKKVADDTITFGPHTRFASDARTVIIRQELSMEYVVNNLVKATPIDKCQFAVYDSSVDGWMVKGGSND